MKQQLFNIRLKIKQMMHLVAKQLRVPHHCLLCTTSVTQHMLCESCFFELPWHTAPKCAQCHLPSNHEICGKCLKSPPFFDSTISVYRYDFPINHMIGQYKYQEALHISAFFAKALLKTLKQTPLTNKNNMARPIIDLIIPMPMHTLRLQERGFNQAVEIAKKVSEVLSIAIDYTACKRVVHNPPQASLPLKKRQHNVAGVFVCQKSLAGLNVAIIDDVMTTGASLNELARTLKNAGAQYVECWVIARTLPK